VEPREEEEEEEEEELYFIPYSLLIISLANISVTLPTFPSFYGYITFYSSERILYEPKISRDLMKNCKIQAVIQIISLQTK
jgi:hypothetical protein